MIDQVDTMKEMPVLPPVQGRSPAGVERDALYLGPYLCLGSARG